MSDFSPAGPEALPMQSSWGSSSGQARKAFRQWNWAEESSGSMIQSALRAIPGIGEVKAVKLLCLSEIARRIVREKIRREQKFDSPEAIADYYMESMRHLETEQTVVLHFDSKMTLLGEDIMTVGTVSGAMISPREIYIKALRRQAVRIVLLHNHPSGDPSPSREDITATRQVRKAGEILGISLTDHIIIGDLCYCSLKEMGFLSDETTEF